MQKVDNFVYGSSATGRHYVTGNTRRSILECHMIYSNLTDLEFAAWYEKRYKIKAGAVLAVINEKKSSPA